MAARPRRQWRVQPPTAIEVQATEWARSCSAADLDLVLAVLVRERDYRTRQASWADEVLARLN